MRRQKQTTATTTETSASSLHHDFKKIDNDNNHTESILEILLQCSVQTKTKYWILALLPKPKLRPQPRRAQPCQTPASSPLTVKFTAMYSNMLPPKLLTSCLTTLPQNPDPKLQPQTTENSSPLQPQPVFVLRVRKAEDRPVGVIIPPLPEEVFV